MGPAASSPKIEWDASGNTGADYLEVRPSVIATTAKLTLKKSVGLIYSVWFVDDAALVIDAASEESGAFGETHGLMANESKAEGDEGGSDADFNFYANTTNTVITVKTGNTLDGRFLTKGAKKYSDATSLFIRASESDTVIAGANTGDSVDYVESSTNISGYLIPHPNDSEDGG